MIRTLTGFILVWLSVCTVQAQLPATTAPGKWKGFDRTFFNIDQHRAYYVKPSTPLPGRPWVWRASFPDWHTDIDSILLSRGFYVAYVNIDDEYGSAHAMRVWQDAWDYFTDSVGLAKSVALEAVSRGALYAFGWAKRNPDKVNCIYSEAPVCDIKSWPGGKGKGLGDTACWQQFKQVFHFNEQQAMAYADNPVDRLEGLAAFKVPLLNVISVNDQLVPPAENALVLARQYIAAGGPVTTYPVTDGPQELHHHHFPISPAGHFAQFIYDNAYPVKATLPYDNYISIRGGLDHFYSACTEKHQATVAFLGGSLTYNPGWRDKVCAYLKERFPQTDFHFIAAGIPSLGSLPHAFRLQQDVLDSGNIDLLFIEAAVNDRVNGTDSTTQIRSLEGIIRHAKRSSPLMDMVMMSFADPYKISDYDKGITPVEITNHEMMAGHYHLPSINLGKEVRDKVRNHEFSWEYDFRDIHPSPFGQELYFATIKKLLRRCEEQFNKGERSNRFSLQKAIDNAAFINGGYYSVHNTHHDAGWILDERWKPSDSAGTREGFVNVPVLASDQPGATVTFTFTGTAAGMAVVSGPDAGMIEYAIDNDAWKQINLYTEWSNWLHLPWYVLFGSGMKNKQHTIQVRISHVKPPASKGYACRIVHFLVNKN